MLTELLPNKGQKQLKQTEGLQNRVWDDVMQRTKPGILIYPIFWLIIAYGSGFYKSHFILTWTLEFVFILASFWRFFQFKYLEHWQTSCPTIWAAGLLISVVTHSLGWGIMFGYSTFIDNTAFSFFMGFSSSGIAAGGTNSFAPKRILATSFIITFTLPPLIAAIIAGDQWVMASLISVFIVYTLNLAKQQNREYWRSLTNEVILEKQSRTDALTSLKNRRFFDEKLYELCQLSSRNQEYISVLVIDIDHFKKVNDKLGHDFGDECLRQLARVFESCLPRATDVCARYGGEEFAIILTGTNTSGAEQVAENIRKKVEAHIVKYNQQEMRLTVSIGLVSKMLKTFDKNIPTELFKSADEALYNAKTKSRNCVVISANSAIN